MWTTRTARLRRQSGGLVTTTSGLRDLRCFTGFDWGRRLVWRATRSSAAFLAAADATASFDLPWCSAEIPLYPAHGILRQAALVHASRGHVEAAIEAIHRLRNDLAPIRTKQIVLGTVQLAATAEVAVLLWPSSPDLSREILAGDDTDPSALKQQLANFKRQIDGLFPKISALFDPWASTIDAILAAGDGSDAARSKLLSLARRIGY